MPSLKNIPRKLGGFLLTFAGVIVAGLIVNPASVSAVTIAMVSAYGIFATGHTVTDVMSPSSKPTQEEGS